MAIQVSMIGLVVRDMAASLAFYRRLGLDVPADADARRFVEHRMESGVTLFWDTVWTDQHDPAHHPVQDGYGILLEFFLADTDAVDAKYAELTAAGYHGRMAPKQTEGPYAAMVDDPDGNVALITAG
jgi:predicted lactoylglutathione lyase